MAADEAVAPEQGVALRQLKQSCKSLRDVLGAMYEQKSAGGRERERHRSDADKARAKDQRWRALLLLRGVKAGLRDTFLASDEWKARVQEQKDRVEAHQLKLQNLLYEKDHLVREIRRCRGFSTKEMDKIEFESGALPISVDADVHRQHLDQLTQELATRKRLQEELKQLKAKIGEVDTASQTKQSFLDGLREQLSTIEDATSGLQSYMGEPVTAQLRRQHAAQQLPTPLYALYCELEAYQTASETSQQLMLEVVDAVDIVANKQRGAAHAKRSFPAALLAGGASGSDDHGSRPASAATKRQKVVTPSRSPSSGQLSALPVPSRSPSQSRGKSADEKPEESGEAGATNTAEKLLALKPHEQTNESTDAAKTEPSIAPVAKRQQSNDAMEVDDEEGVVAEPATTSSSPSGSLHNLWEPSSKALQLTLNITTTDADASGSESTSGSFTLLFQYLPNAKLVTTEIFKSTPGGFAHGRQNVLMNLFPGDDGLSIPRAASTYALAAIRGGNEDGDDTAQDVSVDQEIEYPASATSRPYHWAQWICGLYSLPRVQDADANDVAPRRRPEPSIRNVISQLTKRFVATMVVKKQLEQLAKAARGSETSSGVAVASAARHLFPGEPRTRLVEWKELAPRRNDPFAFSQVSKGGNAPSFYLPTTGCRYFRAEFRNSSMHVPVLVELSPEFPVRAPRFLFQSRAAAGTNKATENGQLPLYDNQLKEVEVEVNAFYDELLPRGCPPTFLLMHQLRKVQQCLDVLAASANEGEAATLCFGREHRGKDRRHAIVMDSVSKDLRHR